LAIGSAPQIRESLAFVAVVAHHEHVIGRYDIVDLRVARRRRRGLGLDDLAEHLVGRLAAILCMRAARRIA